MKGVSPWIYVLIDLMVLFFFSSCIVSNVAHLPHPNSDRVDWALCITIPEATVCSSGLLSGVLVISTV